MEEFTRGLAHLTLMNETAFIRATQKALKKTCKAGFNTD